MSALGQSNVKKISDAAYEVTIYDATGTECGAWHISAWTSLTSWQVMWIPRGASMFAGYPGEPRYPYEGDFASAEAAVSWCLEEGAR